MKIFIFLTLVLTAFWASADTLIYQENFDGPAGTDLNGRTPAVAPAGITWLAGPGFDADGTLTYSGTGFGNTAYLPFVPEHGRVYMLSATINSIQASGQSADNWLALGFTQRQVSPSLRFFSDGGTTSYPVCWGLSRTSVSSGNDQTFLGPDTAGALTTDTVSADQVAIGLNTTQTVWEAQWYYNGVLKRTENIPAGIQSTIRYLAVSNSRCHGIIDNLVLRSASAAALISQPADAVVRAPAAVSFTTVLESSSAPAVKWFKTGPEGTVEIAGQSNMQTSIVFDPAIQRYSAVLTVTETCVADSGRFYCQITAEGLSFNTRSALLTVEGPAAHWPMDQEYFVSGRYADLVGGFDASAQGIPVFSTGADGKPLGAVRISPESGWASTHFKDPASTGKMTVCLWANWQDPSATDEDLALTSQPDGNTLTAAKGLKAHTKWQQICVVFDGGTGKLYLDGILTAQGPWTLPANLTSLLDIGSAQAGQEPFRGELDDLRLYNYPLVDHQIADLYYAVSGQGVCLAEGRSPYDLSGADGLADCIVNLYDLVKFADRWLTDYHLTQFAEMADVWMTCSLYPNCD